MHIKKIKSITVFIDIEGAFDNTGYDVIMKEAKNKGVKDWIVNWIESMLKSRRIKAQGNESSIEYNPTRGCPQGGCLSPLLWCLVVDDLINKLEKEGLHVIAYADDLAITATAANSKMNLTTVIEKINRGMKIVEEWCAVSGLNVNPNKSCFMRFSPGTPRNETKININLFQQEIKQVKQFKYLGVIIDENLRWTAHVDCALEKGRKTLWAAKSIVSRNWGMSPKKVTWLYQQVVLPRVLYGSLIWWHKVQENLTKAKFTKLQRMALLMISGATRSTPTAALEAILNIPPIDIKIRTLAVKACDRLLQEKLWLKYPSPSKAPNHNIKKKHTDILDLKNSLIEENINDRCNTEMLRNDFITVVDDKSCWNSLIKNKFCWFTDGTCKEGKAGYGIYNPITNESYQGRLSGNANIIQAELKAVERCAREILSKNLENQDIFILSDCLEAIKSLRNPYVRSNTTKQCKIELNKISKNNNVLVGWVPSHSGVEGNFTADLLAKGSILNQNLTIESVLKTDTAKENTFMNWENDNCFKNWQESKSNLRFCNIMMGDIDLDKSNFARNCPRRELKTLIGCLTGHACHLKFLKRIGILELDNCRFCKKDIPEDMTHLLHHCEALKDARNEVFGSEYLYLGELNNCDYKNLIQFCKISEVQKLFNKWND